MIRVVYVSPDCGEYIGNLEMMTEGELLTFVRNSNDCEIYSLAEFQVKFNDEQISDMGFIFFIGKE